MRLALRMSLYARERPPVTTAVFEDVVRMSPIYSSTHSRLGYRADGTADVRANLYGAIGGHLQVTDDDAVGCRGLGHHPVEHRVDADLIARGNTEAFHLGHEASGQVADL